MTKQFLILFSLLIFILACQEEVKPIVDNQVSEGEIPTQESWDSKIYISDNGNLKAVVFANHIRMYEDKKETLLDTVKINFYDKDGNKVSMLTSHKGRVDDASQNMWAIDSVVAVNDSGTVLRTDELKWESKTRKITTDKFVTITTQDERIEGYGFVSDQGLENYTIYNITYSARTNSK